MSSIVKRFEECPYHCNSNGTILDPNLGKLIPCPYCSEKRKSLLDSGMAQTDEEDDPIPVWEALGLKNNQYLSDRFVFDTIIPDGEGLFLDKDTVSHLKEVSEEVYLGLTNGYLPDHSICFGVSRAGDVERFVYPMLVKAYRAGLTVGKLYTAREINEGFLRQLGDPGKIESYDLHKVDLLCIVYSEDSDSACAHTVQGVMQVRSLKGKPTIIVTTSKVEACSQFLGYYDRPSFSLASPVFAIYKSHKKGYSSYINNLLGMTNTNTGASDQAVESPTGSNAGVGTTSTGSKVVTSMSELLRMGVSE